MLPCTRPPEPRLNFAPAPNRAGWCLKSPTAAPDCRRAIRRDCSTAFTGAPAPRQGMGLGLSLVKGFTEAQGGTAKAAHRPGGGALFTVRLPLAIMPPVPEEKE